jgi:hypothetical protein
MKRPDTYIYNIYAARRTGTHGGQTAIAYLKYAHRPIRDNRGRPGHPHPHTATHTALPRYHDSCRMRALAPAPPCTLPAASCLPVARSLLGPAQHKSTGPCSPLLVACAASFAYIVYASCARPSGALLPRDAAPVTVTLCHCHC